MELVVISDREVELVLAMDRVIELNEMVFREKALKRVQMPSKVYLFFNRHQGDLRAMPAYLEFLDVACVKLVNSHPLNPSLHGLPTIMATILLFDPRTGRPLCIMNGTLITGARTGAAAAIATKHLARGGSKVVGIIGAGFIARFHVEALSRVMEMRRVYVYDVVRHKAERLVKEFEHKLEAKMVVADNPREAVESADVIATLTPSRAPIVKSEWVREGVHINAMGADAPGKQELDPEILRRSKIVVDDIEQASHSGEINVPLSQGIIKLSDIYAELGEVVAGIKRGRESDREVTMFDSTGLAIQDAITAYHVYEEALKRGLGTRIEL